MSISNNTENAWNNTEEESAPTIEDPIERIEDPIERIEDPIERIVIENTPVVDSISDIKEENIEEINEIGLPIDSDLTESESIVIVDPSDNAVETENKPTSPTSSLNSIIQKIKDLPNYLHKKLNLRCALCSSV